MLRTTAPVLLSHSRYSTGRERVSSRPPRWSVTFHNTSCLVVYGTRNIHTFCNIVIFGATRLFGIVTAASILNYGKSRKQKIGFNKKLSYSVVFFLLIDNIIYIYIFIYLVSFMEKKYCKTRTAGRTGRLHRRYIAV